MTNLNRLKPSELRRVIRNQIQRFNPQKAKDEIAKFTVQEEQVPIMLSTMDNQFSDLKATVAQFRPKRNVTDIPDIKFSPQEKKLLKRKSEELNELEAYISRQYQNEFINLGWHGETSWQRMIFQDPKVLAALSDSVTVKLMLQRAKDNNEQKFGGTVTLSGLIFSGIQSNNVSYLATAAPNWMSRPVLNSEAWGDLRGMAVPTNPNDKPWRADATYVTGLQRALSNMQSVFSEVNGNKPVAQPSEAKQEILEAIHKASTEQLLQIIDNICDTEAKTGILTAGRAGASTQSRSMNGQCLDVIQAFPRLVEYYKQNPSAEAGFGTGPVSLAMNNGLTSHALDAKHLLAALFYRRNPDDSGHNGYDSFKQLIEDAKQGFGDPDADMMFRMRLQQCMQVILFKAKDLGLDDQALLNEIRVASQNVDNTITQQVDHNENIDPNINLPKDQNSEPVTSAKSGMLSQDAQDDAVTMLIKISTDAQNILMQSLINQNVFSKNPPMMFALNATTATYRTEKQALVDTLMKETHKLIEKMGELTPEDVSKFNEFVSAISEENYNINVKYSSSTEKGPFITLISDIQKEINMFADKHGLQVTPEKETPSQKNSDRLKN